MYLRLLLNLVVVQHGMQRMLLIYHIRIGITLPIAIFRIVVIFQRMALKMHLVDVYWDGVVVIRQNVIEINK